MASVRVLQPGDVHFVADNLRAADRAELAAALGPFDARSTLASCVLSSSECWAFADHEPLALFGVAPLSLLGGTGAPWLLGTERLFDFPSALVREGRRYVHRMLGAYPHLVNYVDARNDRSVRWLACVGFTVHAPEPYGRAGLPFRRFEMRA